MRPEGSHEERQALGPALVRKFGRRKADRLVRIIVGWGICHGEWVAAGAKGRLTIEQYGDRWGKSSSMAYRDIRCFRECFPDDVWPDRVWGLIREDVYGEDLDTASADGFAVRVPGDWERPG